MFSQHLRVVSGDVIYAAALNPGRLRLGLYRIDATLAGAHQSAWFVVNDPIGALAAPASAQTSTPAGTTATTASYVEDDDASTTDGTGTPTGVGMAETPTSGPTGTVAPPSAPTSGPGCQPEINGDASGTVYVEWTACAGDDIGITATVNGKTELVQTAHAADADIPVRVDPCSIDPSVGYGGTPVSYTATVLLGPDKGKSATVSGTQTLDAPTNPPKLVPVNYNPALESQVGEGDQILLSFEAQSAVGIRSVTVTGPGGTLKQATYTKQPTRCTAKGTDQIVVVPPYTVPANPPAIITITAVATDFAGRSTTVVLQYPTEAVWLGLARGPGTAKLASQEDPGDYGGLCTAQWTMYLEVGISAKKAVSGDAQATTQSIPCVVIGPDFDPITIPGGVSTFKVTGTYDGKTFRLMFPPVQTNEAYAAGSMFLLDTNGTGNFGGYTPATFVFVRKYADFAPAKPPLDVIGPGVEGGTSLALDELKLEGDLICCSPDAGPTIQATKTPPIFIP
jgi:hypothetical protein